MPTLKCKMCGGDLIVEENSTVCECEYCGTKQTVPTIDDEKILKLYDRANRLRMTSEFDKAATVYESIVAESDTEAEAYWGLLLCKYGIEYVDDPATGDKVPTCHRSSFDSIMEDSDFEMVMENADSVSRNVYREQAKQIEEIRRGIIEVSGKEQPYDIFICYKETAENGDRTIDSVLAQDVYDELTTKGYRVFFSRITLEDKLGQEYEPYIFAALNSAKIMLVFGTSYDYYNAVWVKNEWSRYLKLMSRDKEKHLIPCYKDIDAYDIPKEFKHLQAQDMGKVGAIQDLVRGIDKLTGRKEKQEQSQEAPVVQQVVQQIVQGGESKSNAMVKRGNLALEDHEWEKADEFFEEALNQDPECAEAYLGKLLVENEVESLEELGYTSEELEEEKLYQKVLRFADDELKLKLKKALEDIEFFEKNSTYQRAISCKNEMDYEIAIEWFGKIIDFEDAKEQIDECKKLAKQKKDIENELSKKADTLAEEIKKYGKQNPEYVLRNQIKAKESTINLLNNRAVKLQNLAGRLPSLEAENSKLRTEFTNFNNKMNALNQELNGLGFFAGKRKKEIAGEMDNLRLLIKKKEDEIKENTDKMKGCNSSNIQSRIADIFKEVQQAKNELEELNKRLEDVQKSYDEFMNLLNDNAFRSVFIGKYIELYLKYLEIRGFKTKGNNIIFGKYKNAEIEWKVLGVVDSKLLIVSEKGLDCVPYNKMCEDTTWEKCTLRQWLNNDFINDAFSDSEKKVIALTDVIATKNPKYDINPGNNTKDKVFLLSIDEVMKYFADDKARQCLPAASASKAYKSDGSSSCWWWLRSPGIDSFIAADVSSVGSVDHGGNRVNCVKLAVRPALWINLES